MIKKLNILYFLILILIFSCEKKSYDEVILRGEIVGSHTGEKSVLKLYRVFEDRRVAVDSAELKGEKPEFEFILKNEGIYGVGISGKEAKHTLLILQKDKPVQIIVKTNGKKTDVQIKDREQHMISSVLYDLIETDNNKFYSYLKLTKKDKAKSSLKSVFIKKQQSALQGFRKEKNSSLRQLEAFRYVNYTYFLGTMDYYDNLKSDHNKELATAKQIFKILPPESFYWSYNNQLPMMLLSGYRFPFTLSGFSDSLKENRSILDTLIIEQSDVNVSGYTNIFTLYSYTLSDDKTQVKKYTDLYFRRDTAAYDKEIKSMFNEFFSPERKIREGEQLPEFSIPALDNPEIVYTNNSFKGVYLIDFWATWCKPCMKEIPFHHQAYQKYHQSEHFDILSISFDRSPDQVIKFRKNKWPMPWKHALLVKGKNDPLSKRMSASFLPQMILVDGKTNRILAELIRLKEGNLEKILDAYYNN